MNLTPRAKGCWTNCYSALLDLVYPRRCSLCELFSDSNPCIQCRGEMQHSEPVVTYHSEGEIAFQGTVFRYPGRAGQAVRRLKYDRRTGLAAFMAQSIADALEVEGINYDIAMPIPIHWFRLVGRGFNQADLLSEPLSNRQTGLRRIRPTQPQAGLDTAARLKNLDGAFEVTANVRGKTVLLIDDVVTSGQTARECAKALRAAKAAEVGVFAFCGDNY